MKLAITGKGGVGKTTLSAGLATLFSRDGRDVVAIDADPDTNLALALGVAPREAERIVPLSEMRDLIRERMGSAGGEGGGFVTLNPRVDDIADSYGVPVNGMRLLVMGAVRKGGGGCACPENVLLQSLLEHLLVEANEVVIADMEAGIEHLGRGTARAVDMLVVVVEPTKAAMHTAQTIAKLARDLGLGRLGLVVNKVRDEAQSVPVVEAIRDIPLLGSLPWRDEMARTALEGVPVADTAVLDDIVQVKTAIEASLA